VDAAVGSVNNSHDLTHYLIGSIDVYFVRCISMKNQLHSELFELKSAWFIIRLLQEDINMTVVPEVASTEKPANHSELSDCQTIKGNWILVITDHSKNSTT